MISLSNFANILAHISPTNKRIYIFKSRGNGLLKNVQDGISRPLGSQEISISGHPVQPEFCMNAF